MTTHAPRRRTMVEIVTKILLMEQAGKTEIMNGTALNYNQLEQYLGWLQEKGLIQRVDDVARKPLYQATEKGRVLLPHCEALMEGLELGTAKKSLQGAPASA